MASVKESSGPGAVAIGDMYLQGDNLNAINKYMMETKIKTKDAGDLQKAWITWWKGLGWYDKSIDQDIYDQARNRRNAFNLANAKTAKEKDQVKKVLETGLTSEELLGEVRRAAADGSYVENKDVVKEPFFPTRVKVAAGITVAAAAALYLAKSIYLDPFLKIRKLL